MSESVASPDVQIIEASVEEPTAKLKNRHRIKGIPLELPPCCICNGKASGIHYGVNSCEACKGFFRRYLSRKEPYKCHKNNKCEISERPRGNCSACRMQKCLQLGMSKGAVRQGRYTLEERTKTIRAVQSLQGKVTDQIDSSIEQIATNIVSAVFEEDALRSMETEQSDLTSSSVLNCSTNNVVDSSLSPLYKSVSLGVSRSSDGWNSSPSSSPGSSITSPPNSNIQDSEERQKVLSQLQLAYDNFSYPSRKFTDEQLEAKFREALEEHRIKGEVFGPMKKIPAEEYNEIFEATGLDIDGRHDRMLKERELWEDIISQYVGFAKAIPGFTSITIQDQATLLKAARFEFFIILEYKCINPDLEVMVVSSGEAFHLEDICYYLPVPMIKKWFDFTRKIKALNFSQEEMLIILAVCLTFSDRARLDNAEQVERIQLNLLEYLRQLLKEHHGNNDSVMFTKIMDMFIGFRELNNEYLTEFKKLCNDRVIVQTIPEMLEFLFDDT